MDPTYGRNEFLTSDARWTACLARDLAIALRVPLRDAVFGTTVDPVLAAAAQSLARAIERLPAAGAFDSIATEVLVADHRTQLRCAPSPSNPQARRFVEVCVRSPSGLSTSSQWLDSGSNEELAALLRWPETPGEIERIVRELIESRQRNRMA
jgi:hypothetical protein